MAEILPTTSGSVRNANTVMVPDPDWPAPGSGTTVGYPRALTGQIFKMYWFACHPDHVGDALSTGDYPHGTGRAQWADDSDPPVVDDCFEFGMLHWGAPASLRLAGRGVIMARRREGISPVPALAAAWSPRISGP